MTRFATAVPSILLLISSSWYFVESKVSQSGSDGKESFQHREKCESEASQGHDKATGQGSEENTCTLYIAESSMRNVNGMGLFTVKDFKRGDLILQNDAPTIPVLNPWDADPILNHYWWGEGKGTADEVSFETDDYVCDYGVTFATLPNYHTYLMNFNAQPDDPPYDDTFITTTGNPGAGAFSYHNGRSGVAMKDIEAGDEIFLDYGLDPDSDYYEWFQHVPKWDDFEDAGYILERNWKYLEDLRHDLRDPELKVLGHVLAVMNNTADAFNYRVASILPKTPSEYDRVAERVRQPNQRDFSEAVAKELHLRTRSVDWIKENGRCIDNMVPGRSKLPYAGRGAIAQRFIARGDVIVPSPLLHIMNRDRLAMWDGERHEKQVGTQLLLNYCFGHDESSLLLCPITNAVLINHCSNRTKECGEDGPNAEYRWATTFDRDTERWLKMSLDEMARESGRGLSFEIVATRDIQPGDEIFMDYGRAWEEAWAQHVANWDADGNKPVESVTKWNEEIGPVRIMSGDLRQLADHPKFQTGCVYWEDDEEDDDVLRDDSWQDWSDERILQVYGRDGSHFFPEHSRNYQSGGVYWSCSVVREDNDGTYIVRVFPSSFALHGTPEWYLESIPRFLTSFPRRSIRYFTQPYKSDVHLPKAFRHHIEIRDDIFPTQWRDRRRSIFSLLIGETVDKISRLWTGERVKDFGGRQSTH